MRTASERARIIAGGIVVLAILVLVLMNLRIGGGGHGADDPRPDSPSEETTQADPGSAADGDPEGDHLVAMVPAEPQQRTDGEAVPVVLRLAPVQIFDGFRWPHEGVGGPRIQWRYSFESDIGDLKSIGERMLDASEESEIWVSDLRALGERKLVLAGEGEDYDAVPSVIGVDAILHAMDEQEKASPKSLDDKTASMGDSSSTERNYAIWELPLDSIESIKGRVADEANGNIPVLTIHAPIVPLSRWVIETSFPLAAFNQEWNEVVYEDEMWTLEHLIAPKLQKNPEMLWNLYCMGIGPLARQRRFDARDSRLVISGHMHGRRKFVLAMPTPERTRLFETRTLQSSLGMESVSELMEIATSILEVSVFEENGTAIQDATVRVRRLYDTDSHGVERYDRVAGGRVLEDKDAATWVQRSDEEGRTLFVGLPYGFYRISVIPEEGLPKHATRLLRQGEITKESFILCRGDGEPRHIRLANPKDEYNSYQVYMTPWGQNLKPIAESGRMVKIADMPLLIEDETVSGWSFSLAEGNDQFAYRAAIDPASRYIQNTGCGDVELMIQDLGHLELRVTNLQGKPMGPVKVQFARVPTLLTSQSLNLSFGDHLYWRLDESGSCTLSAFHPFLYAVLPQDSQVPLGFVDFRDKSSTGGSQVTHLRVSDQEANIVVRNRETEQPLEDALIFVLNRGGLEHWYSGSSTGRTGWARGESVAATGKDGRTSLPYLPETLDLLVWAKGFRSHLQPLDAPHATELWIDLTPAQTVPVVMIDSATRLPIPGVRALRAVSDNPGPAIMVHSGLSDWDGQMDVEGLPVPFKGTLLVAREAFVKDEWEGRPVWTEHLSVETTDSGRVEVVVSASALE